MGTIIQILKIERVIKENYEELYTNKSDNLDEMDMVL